jgi:hypothetical protein
MNTHSHRALLHYIACMLRLPADSCYVDNLAIIV